MKDPLLNWVIKMHDSHTQTANDFVANDIYGNKHQLSIHSKKPVILSFFQDVFDPFVNLRLYEITQQYKSWSAIDVDVIAVFASTETEVLRFEKSCPRPFISIADPDLNIFKLFGLGDTTKKPARSLSRKLPLPIQNMIYKNRKTRADTKKAGMSADFLIGPNNQIIERYCGDLESDRMPMSEVAAIFRVAGSFIKRPTAPIPLI